MRPEILKRGIKVGLLVGTVLALINHGEKIFTMTMDLESLVQVGLTYLVPFGVSTWSSVQTARSKGSPK
ncbi:MAG: nitrate/nitrite transporter NrtS [Halioglobus sp.]